MPYCPKCHAEYREGFTKCADCNVDLVDELPKAEKHKEDKIQFEKLVHVNNNIELSYITSMLKEEGIVYRLISGRAAGVFETKKGRISPKNVIYVDKNKINEAMAIVLSIAGDIVEDE